MSNRFNSRENKVPTTRQPRMNTVADKEPVKVDDESQQLEDEQKEYKVIFNNQSFAMIVDEGGARWANKKGHANIDIQNNGDVIILSGSGGNGKACGGRILINTKSGKVEKHRGPVITEASASPKSPTKGEGSDTTESSAKDNLACSNLYYGDAITECHGEVRIKATNIVIEAADVLSLVGKSKVLIQAGPSGGGEIQMNAGKITQLADTREEITTGQIMKIVSEDTTLQFDPRASVNTVSPGHVNWQILGDFKQNIGGVANITVLGKPSVPPLVEERAASYMLTTVAGGVMLTSAALFDLNAGKTTFKTADLEVNSAKTDIKTADLNVDSAKVDILGSGDVSITGANVRITGALIYLN